MDMTQTSITVSHSHTEGTLVHGTARNDGSADALKTVGCWRWSRNLGAWYMPHSRDKAAQSYRIDQTRTALEAAGFEVTVEIDDTRRSIADVEADRVERSAARVDALAGKGERLSAKGEAAWQQARDMASNIPMGQPLLVDHYSYGRDVRYRARINAKEDRAFEALREGERASERSAAAEANQAHRMNGDTTERRIAKLEADHRYAQRNGWSSERIAELEEQLTYWRAHLAALVDSGEYKKWGPGDFTKGDRARIYGRWYQVVKVNKKSLTVPSSLGPWTDTISYDKVSGRQTAA